MLAKDIETTIAKLHPWWKTALDHARTNASWFAVKVGSDEYKAWAKHFAAIGYTPYFFRTARQECTLPCQWPEWMPAIPSEAATKQTKQSETAPKQAPKT
jgi:hypothetical protein